MGQKRRRFGKPDNNIFYVLNFYIYFFLCQADDSETYTTRQLLADISGCMANQVILMVDQSYSGVFVNELRSLKETTAQLDNVVLVVNGEFSEYSWAQDVTSHWGDLSHLRSISWSTDVRIICLNSEYD